MNEQQARDDILRYCRELWDRGLISGSSGNVSVRLHDGTLLVTPAGRSLRNLRAEELARVSADGAPLDTRTATSELPLHVACYRARSDVHAIVHTHPRYCVAWSRNGTVFPQDTVGARETLGPVEWSSYHPPRSAELATAVAQAAIRADTILMERHGLTALGSELEAAFLRSDLAEEAAAIGYLGHFRNSPA